MGAGMGNGEGVGGAVGLAQVLWSVAVALDLGESVRTAELVAAVIVQMGFWVQNG